MCTVELELIQSIYVGHPDRALPDLPAGLPAGFKPQWEGMERLPPRSQTWLRVFARQHQVRLESVCLHPGTSRTCLPVWLLGPRCFVRKPTGEEVEADFVRALQVWDGTRYISYNNAQNFWVSRPTMWSGAPSSHPLVRSVLSLGTTTATFGQILGGAPQRSTVTTEVRGGTGQVGEYTVNIRIERGSILGRRMATVAPRFGYAVTSWEHRIDATIRGTHYGSGEVHQASDFRQVAEGIWLPYRSVHQRFVYDPEKSPWRRTEVVEIREAHVNRQLADALFRPVPPLGAIVEQPIPGPAVQDCRRALDWVKERSESFLTTPPPTIEPDLNEKVTDQPDAATAGSTTDAEPAREAPKQ